MKNLVLKIAAGVAAVVLIVLVGGWLALQRGDIPYATLESRYATATSRYVDLPGGLHLHYRDQGLPTGPAVLLLHGFAMSTDTWEPWVRLLGRNYRIITLDLPGFGLTRAPAKGFDDSYQAMAGVVDAFARAEHLDRFVIGGSSMGGGVAWRYALKHPEHTRGLILVDASGWPAPAAAAIDSPLIRAARNPVLQPLLLKVDSSASLRNGFRAAFADPSRADAAFLKRYGDMARAPGRRLVWLNLLGDWPKQDFATPQRLAGIKAPTLILWGAKDRLVPPADGRRFVAAIPGAHLITYPDVGHLPEEEAAEASAADVGAFLHSLDAPKKAAAAATASADPPKKPEKNLLVFY